jgi:hypothetical protein
MTIPMKAVGKFIVHLGAAFIGSMVLGFIFSQSLYPSGTIDPWFDPPYSAFWWGSAFVLGVCTNALLKDRSAQWVWPIGVSWLIFWIVISAAGYSPRSSYGYSPGQYIWHEYFTNRDCLAECLGLLFTTTPALNSLAYSIGAMLGLKLFKSSGVTPLIETP